MRQLGDGKKVLLAFVDPFVQLRTLYSEIARATFKYRQGSVFDTVWFCSVLCMNLTQSMHRIMVLSLNYFHRP